MWFIIIVFIILIIIISIIASNTPTSATNNTDCSGKGNSDYKNNVNFETITDTDKQQLAYAGGNNLLSFTIDQYQKAVNGDTNAMISLGAIYQSKINNAPKAAFWYATAHRFGNLEGTYWYGECCIRGYGVEKDGMLGYGYILMAAQKGNQSAIESFRERGMSVEEMRSNGIPV